jgi:hypothetical protein
MCKMLRPNCAACDNHLDCTSCQKGYQLQNRRCPVCMPGYERVRAGMSSKFLCKQCKIGSVSADGIKCTTCPKGTRANKENTQCIGSGE